MQPSPYPRPFNPDTDAPPAMSRRWAPGFWRRASTGRKALYVGGTVAAVGGLVWFVRWVRRPRPVRGLTAQCNDFAMGDRQEVNEAVRPLVRRAAREGGVDPFGVATEFMRRYAPDCRPYPEEVRNPGEAELFIRSFEEVLRVMEEERLVSPQQRSYFLEMVSVWGRSQGVPTKDLPGGRPKVTLIESEPIPGYEPPIEFPGVS